MEIEQTDRSLQYKRKWYAEEHKRLIGVLKAYPIDKVTFVLDRLSDNPNVNQNNIYALEIANNILAQSKRGFRELTLMVDRVKKIFLIPQERNFPQEPLQAA